MFYCYTIEIFYQEEKRQQVFPFAQLIGRTDFALFPVAGYLCAGTPDLTALLYFAFFYPFALAHLGANDLIDVANDRARGMKTVPLLFSMDGAAYWIAGFTAVHIVTAAIFMVKLGWIARCGYHCRAGPAPVRELGHPERTRRRMRRSGCSPASMPRWCCMRAGLSLGALV